MNLQNSINKKTIEGFFEVTNLLFFSKGVFVCFFWKRVRGKAL